MPGVYRPCHPERTVLYRVLFDYFGRFLTAYEVDPMICPRCGGRMKVVAFLTEYAVVDRIIRHLQLTFAAEKLPPAYALEQIALTAAEENGEYE
jgi:hypothetical protein